MRLALSTHPYLADHSIKGRPILPLACAMEMMAEHLELAYPIVLSEVQVIRGLMLRGPTEVAFEVEQAVIELHEVRPSGRRVPAFSAELGEGTPSPPVEKSRVGMEPPPIPLDRFYGCQTFHGPEFQGIAELGHGSRDRMEARLKCWPHGRPRVDPLVVDSAFQLAIYWCLSHYGRGLLPRGVEQAVFLEPLGPEPVDLTIELVEALEDGLVGNFRFQHQGRLQGWLEGVEAKFVDPELLRPS